ncbi:unannotated protein [freshwater metagenome]|uniref:Unannotated protein n=1 Tax=freshwater metagenome TaxID=449393 RepID=A0A6J7FTZ2_9ZZZZ
MQTNIYQEGQPLMHFLEHSLCNLLVPRRKLEAA